LQTIFKSLVIMALVMGLVSGIRPGVSVPYVDKTIKSTTTYYNYFNESLNRTTVGRNTTYINGVKFEPETYCYSRATIHQIYALNKYGTAAVCSICYLDGVDDVKEILNLSSFHQDNPSGVKVQDVLLGSQSTTSNRLLIEFVQGGYEVNLSKFDVKWISNQTNNTIIKLFPKR
jgi:hypothetical protein